MIGRNSNTNDTPTQVTSYTLVANIPLTISVPNPDRINFHVTLGPGAVTPECVWIRPYPAAQDAIEHGYLLVKNFTANNNLLRLFYETPTDNIHVGEFSAITSLTAGSVIYVTEY